MVAGFTLEVLCVISESVKIWHIYLVVEIVFMCCLSFPVKAIGTQGSHRFLKVLKVFFKFNFSKPGKSLI